MPDHYPNCGIGRAQRAREAERKTSPDAAASPIEAVAVAFAENLTNTDWQFVPDKSELMLTKADYLLATRAAIAAIPVTEEMLADALRKFRERLGDEDELVEVVSEDDMKACFEAMRRKALEG